MAKRKDVEQQIQTLRSKGATLGEIAKQLHSEGYKTAGRNKKITSNYVNYVLRKSENGNMTTGTEAKSLKEQDPKIPFRIVKNVLNDSELADGMKIKILKSFYGI
jgi:hypothetical protein